MAAHLAALCVFLNKHTFVNTCRHSVYLFILFDRPLESQNSGLVAFRIDLRGNHPLKYVVIITWIPGYNKMCASDLCCIYVDVSSNSSVPWLKYIRTHSQMLVKWLLKAEVLWHTYPTPTRVGSHCCVGRKWGFSVRPLWHELKLLGRAEWAATSGSLMEGLSWEPRLWSIWAAAISYITSCIHSGLQPSRSK